MTYRLPSVLTTTDLPLAELAGARLDGELFALGDGWCPVDEIEGLQTRADAAGLLVPSRAIAECLTAGWIYGACPEPARHQFFVDPHARVSVHRSARYLIREVRCEPSDIRTLGGTRLTTPVRTIIDLSRNERLTDDEAVPTMSSLLAWCGQGVVHEIALRPAGGTHKNRALAARRLADALSRR